MKSGTLQKRRVVRTLCNQYLTIIKSRSASGTCSSGDTVLGVMTRPNKPPIIFTIRIGYRNMKSTRSVQAVDVVHVHYEMISLLSFKKFNSTEVQVLRDEEEERNSVDLHNISKEINLILFLRD